MNKYITVGLNLLSKYVSVLGFGIKKFFFSVSFPCL